MVILFACDWDSSLWGYIIRNYTFIMVHSFCLQLLLLLKDDCKGHRLAVVLQAAGVSPCPSVQAIRLPIVVHRKQILEEIEL